LAFAQAPPAAVLAHGLDVFNKTCATGYCHGQGGVEAGAPRLAARGFDDAYVSNVIRNGIHGTGMPAFGDMERADLIGVIAYVDSLNGAAPAANAAQAAPPVRPRLAPDGQKGRELFADQVRGLTRCSVCHQADGLGIAVALPFKTIPPDVAALRLVATPTVETATAEGETFPVLILNRNGAQPKAYDLTTPPPVLRTFTKGEVTFKPGSNWKHESMLAPYSDQELASVLIFLKAVTKP
jgi:mono/diheme cytochrome c family protein